MGNKILGNREITDYCCLLCVHHQLDIEDLIFFCLSIGPKAVSKLFVKVILDV